MGLPNPSRETKFSGANGDREIFIFPVQLTTSRIDKLIRLIHALAICTSLHTYISTLTQVVHVVHIFSKRLSVSRENTL